MEHEKLTVRSEVAGGGGDKKLKILKTKVQIQP